MLTSALRHLAHTPLIATVLLALTACGGGSGGGGPSGPEPTPPDTDPTPFTFEVAENVDLGARVESESVTIEGIDIPVPITVEDGEYALNGEGEDDFTSDEGELEEGDTLVLRGTAPDTLGATQTVTVTVGGYTTTFDIVAMTDTEAPEAAFAFPPPMTATEGDTVIVRGSAEDQWSDISRVTLTVSHEDSVNDYEVDTDDDFATWQQKVTLGPGENLISIQAEDALGNTLDEAERESVTVVQQPFEEAFPDNEVGFEKPRSLIFDVDRNQVLVSDLVENRVVAIDLSTGSRSIFVEGSREEGLSFHEPDGLLLDKFHNRLLIGAISSTESDAILSIDLETAERSVLSSNETPDGDQPSLFSPAGMEVDPSNENQAFLLRSGGDSYLATLDLTTGLRSLISDNEMPGSGPAFRQPTQLLVDEARGRALVSQASSNGILSVDLSTGVREVFLAEEEPEGTPDLIVSALVSSDLEKRVWVQDILSQEIWSVDVESRAIDVVSGDGQPHNNNPLGWFVDMDLSPNKEFIVGVNERSGRTSVVYTIDLVTGERLVLSKPTGSVE